VKTENVSYKSGDDTVTGYLALPEGGGKHPAVIVIHEWWGLNDWVKEQAQKFAAEGYIALAVDLYRGKAATNSGEAHELSRGLPQDRGMRDLEAGFAYLAGRPDVNPDKIGSVGWCMGGGWSLQLAMNQPKLAACIVNYGPLPADAANIARIQAPVLGNFGGDDRGIPPASVNAFAAAMKAADKRVDVKIYEGAGHAFENPNNTSGYRADSAKDAWSRSVAFFRAHLQSSPAPSGLLLVPSPGQLLQDSVRRADEHSGCGEAESLGSAPSGPQGGIGPVRVCPGNPVRILAGRGGVDFTEYVARIVARVQQSWDAVIPDSARRGEKGIVVLDFSVLKDGSMPPGDPQIVRSSLGGLDRAAISAVRASSPFGPLPAGFTCPYARLRLFFCYNIGPKRK
jgi:carboxymethylenebutenolidase